MTLKLVDGVAVLWFPVSDIEKSIAFYTDTLGLSVKEQDGEWAELEAGGLRIGLNQSESPSGDGGGVLAFQPDGGIDAAVSDLEAAGVEVETSDHPWGRIAAFRDPDGNALQFYEPPSE